MQCMVLLASLVFMHAFLLPSSAAADADVPHAALLLLRAYSPSSPHSAAACNGAPAPMPVQVVAG